MPAAGPILTIPAAPLAFDEAVYANDGGYPDPSWFGVNMARTDRWLHANLRRAYCESFPLAHLPRISSLSNGTIVAEVDWYLTPQVQTLQWFLTLQVPVGDELWAVGYTVGPGTPQQFFGLDPLSSKVTPIVGPGPGTVETTYEVDVDVRGCHGIVTVGLVLWSNLDPGGTTANGQVQSFSAGQIVALLTGAFAGWAGVVPAMAAICLTDGVLVGAPTAEQQLCPYHEVAQIGSSGIGGKANDVANVDPADLAFERMGHPSPGNQWGYYIVSLDYADIVAIELREKPLTGSLATVAP